MLSADNDMFEVTVEALAVEQHGKFRPAIKTSFSSDEFTDPITGAVSNPNEQTMMSGNEFDDEAGALSFARGWAESEIHRIKHTMDDIRSKYLAWMENPQRARMVEETKKRIDKRMAEAGDTRTYLDPSGLHGVTGGIFSSLLFPETMPDMGLSDDSDKSTEDKLMSDVAGSNKFILSFAADDMPDIEFDDVQVAIDYATKSLSQVYGDGETLVDSYLFHGCVIGAMIGHQKSVHCVDCRIVIKDDDTEKGRHWVANETGVPEFHDMGKMRAEIDELREQQEALLILLDKLVRSLKDHLIDGVHDPRNSLLVNVYSIRDLAGKVVRENDERNKPDDK